MNEIELLAPAGSMEAVKAAVQNGANAIYLGFGDFNARRNAKNFTDDEMAEVIAYCRARGVKTHITLNTLVSDREFPALCKTIARLNQLSPDAVIVADLGVFRKLSQLAPEIERHASTQLTIHSLAGAQFAADAGFSRVVLSRELPESAISKIAHAVPIETEVFVHGALCMCYSGQCYMSGVIGQRSGNRGLCAQPCRLPYRVNRAKAETYPLSLKDLCLAKELRALRRAGVASLKIEGRMKRPEYVATVCGIYSRLLAEDRAPTEEETARLRAIFNRDGFTDGYFKNQHGVAMFGTRGDEASVPAELYREAKQSYASENPRVGVSFACRIARGCAVTLTATDADGNRHTEEGAFPEEARTRALTAELVREKLMKTGGTPFHAEDAAISIEPGLIVPISAINQLRSACLDAILEKRAARAARPIRENLPLAPILNRVTPPEIAICVQDASQLSDALFALPLSRVYLPLSALSGAKQWLFRAPFGVMLPQIIWDEEWDGVAETLRAAAAHEVTHALVSNVGQIAPTRALGFSVEGDLGLNIFNSEALDLLAECGLSRATLSSELKLSQIRDIRKVIDCEIVAYGRLPLMVTENCLIKCAGFCGAHAHSLTDRRGARFPVFCQPHHRNLICNSETLYLADKRSELLRLGLSRLRLFFTNESADEVCRITREYLEGSDHAPASFTRGLYFRGVE